MTAHIPLVTRLSPRVIRVLGCNPGPMTLQGTNTYLLGTGKRRILIDTGDGRQPEYVDILAGVLKEEGAQVNQVVLTHWHHDHVGGLGPIRSLLHASCRVAKFPCRKNKEKGVYPEGLKVSPLSDGEEVKTEGATLEVVHTPGHTEDHICLKLQEESTVFTGDCVLGEGTAVFEELGPYLQSLRRLIDLNPSKVYPAHGPTLEGKEGGVERIRFYLEHRMKREAQILAAMKEAGDKETTAMELVQKMYVDTPENLHLAAAFNVSHHLRKLAQDGLVERIPPLDAEEEFAGGEENYALLQKNIDDSRWKLVEKKCKH